MNGWSCGVIQTGGQAFVLVLVLVLVLEISGFERCCGRRATLRLVLLVLLLNFESPMGSNLEDDDENEDEDDVPVTLNHTRWRAIRVACYQLPRFPVWATLLHRFMSSLKQLKLAQKSALLQQEVISELNTLVRDIERCDKTISDLQQELTVVNAKYPAPRTTRQDIGYLTDLLKCANKKLAWEKSIASLQKRTPTVLDQLSRLLNDPENPPPDQTRADMLQALQAVQGAMERLQNAAPSAE
jgi:hypothetical protein